MDVRGLGVGARGYGEQCRVACRCCFCLVIDHDTTKRSFQDIHYTPDSDLHQLVGSRSHREPSPASVIVSHVTGIKEWRHLISVNFCLLVTLFLHLVILFSFFSE